MERRAFPYCFYRSALFLKEFGPFGRCDVLIGGLFSTWRIVHNYGEVHAAEAGSLTVSDYILWLVKGWRSS